MEQYYSLKNIQGILVHVLIYQAKGAFLMSSSPNLWNFLISISALVLGRNLLGLFYATFTLFCTFIIRNTVNTVHAVLISFSLVYCILKSFKNEIHFECSPFFSNFLGALHVYPGMFLVSHLQHVGVSCKGFSLFWPFLYLDAHTCFKTSNHEWCQISFSRAE